jgi:glycosyltransferase involved in cell wall biosynthesis
VRFIEALAVASGSLSEEIPNHSRMHIAFLTSEYPPLPHGGIGISIRNLARALIAAGHEVTVVGWGEKLSFEDQGVRVRFLGHASIPRMGWFLNRRRARNELSRLVHEQHVDIVEAQDWCGLSAGMRLPCPIAIRCHGSATYFANLLRERVRPSVRWAESLALKQADGIMAVSRFAADSTRELFGLTKPIRVIPNGVDPFEFQPSAPGEVAGATILYVGTLVRKKGVLDLCEVFSRIIGEGHEARLRLIGRDARDTVTGKGSTWELCRKILSPKAMKHVEYLSVQPHENILSHIRQASLCVFPSYAEAFPLAWLEAMACAKAIVAYDIGWASEIIESGSDGILVPKGDLDSLTQEIISLLQNNDRSMGLGLAARRRVELEFASSVMAASSIDCYQQVLNHR